MRIQSFLRSAARVALGAALALGSAGLVAAVTGGALAPPAQAGNYEPDDIWKDLANDIFKGRAIEKGEGVLALDAPMRAEDAALVPMTITFTLPAQDARRVVKVTLVVDQNPAPVVGTFTVGESSGVNSITTRVRVNDYSQVHAVAELNDGKLYGVERFIKAAGGCSAPAGKNAEEAMLNLGKMKFKQIDRHGANSNALREAQLLVRHPNNSGMQRDQVTLLLIPARFVAEAKIFQGDDLVLAMEGGISISEDPNFRFTYRPNGAKTFRAEIRDTDNKAFSNEFVIDESQG
jgi:sulfur-oxidizing protein SoxY